MKPYLEDFGILTRFRENGAKTSCSNANAKHFALFDVSTDPISLCVLRLTSLKLSRRTTHWQKLHIQNKTVSNKFCSQQFLPAPIIINYTSRPRSTMQKHRFQQENTL